METSEVIYGNLVLVPLAAYDEGMYAAMLVVRKPNEAEQATKVLGRFPSAGEARRYAIDYGMARIAARDLSEPCWINVGKRACDAWNTNRQEA